MLYPQTVYPETLELLTAIMKDEALPSFRLVGGTALALQLGHRIRTSSHDGWSQTGLEKGCQAVCTNSGASK